MQFLVSKEFGAKNKEMTNLTDRCTAKEKNTSKSQKMESQKKNRIADPKENCQHHDDMKRRKKKRRAGKAKKP